MKVKKILIIAISVITFCMLVCSQSMVYADTTSTPLYLGITELMSNNEVDIGGGAKSYFGYAIGDPKANGSTVDSIVAAKIWNIVKYSSETSTDPIDSSIFCLKAGVGFSDTSRKETYNIFYNMKTQKEAIKAQNDTLKSIVEGEITLENGTKVSKYNAILAILDNFYIKGQSAVEEKDALLEAAGIRSEAWSVLLNEDDVKAVQQAALWYFTNYGNSVYDKTGNTGWLNYTTDGNNYTSLSDFKRHDTDEGLQRQQQAEILYKYLIRTAKESTVNYDNQTQSQVPAQINTTTLNYETSGDNYIVGPINITANENTIPYTINFKVKDGETEKTSYSLLDSQKNSTTKSVKELVGNDFYVSIPKNSVTIANLSVEIDINYSNTELTLWASSRNNAAQPVVIPEKKPETISVKLTTPAKKFDLSLRKYITKVDGVELTGNKSRVPNIDENALKTGTTATYKHKKDPVTVEKGSIVTYKMTIYNEGEKAGRATKVVDQLPTGLKFVRVVSGNFSVPSHTEVSNEDNRIELWRNENNTENLDPYKEGSLDSETIEIECEVTADADSKDSKILTNVAWISEEIDGESNITITNQNGADRDSEPSTTPNVNKDNMSDYTGNENKSDLADSNYYYKGQQDDDDFEKLVLMPEEFDLKLIKRIVAVNNQNVPERIKSVDVSKLNVAGGDTTAYYKLDKDPVAVKKGDIVTYTFRIYNEGTIDGYASEITEDIPQGLQFVWSEKEGDDLKADTTLTDEEKEAIEFNQRYLWGTFVYDDERENIIQISTEYLSKDNEATPGANLIKAFGKNDGTKTESDLSYKEISVKLKVVSDNVAGTIIRNEAEISEDTDKDGNSVDDRDSNTEEWKKENSNKYYDDDKKWPVYKEDDEDYDNIILQSFDLALRKFIIAVSKDTTIDNNEYLKNNDGSYKRAPIVDTSKLNTEDENGRLITTAIYNHTKEPVEVSKNDIVVYMLRVYNEGDKDGYASEIKDHLPPYLEFVDGEFNKEYGWSASEDGRTVTTRYLEDKKIGAIYAKEAPTIEGPFGVSYVVAYKEVPIMCKVKDNAKTNEKITNIADITEYKDENKKEVTDRDSQSNNVKLPEDKDLPSYKDDETGDYIPGQQDDDDFEKVIISEEPEIHKGVKTVENQDSGYDATEEHTWVVNSTIPIGIEKYKEYLITDNIDYRLKFVPDSVTVKIGDTTLEEGKDYQFKYTENKTGVKDKTSSGTIEITFIDTENSINISDTLKENAPGTIEVTFNTTFATDSEGNLLAKLGEEIENQAKLKYTNSSNETKDKESEKPEVHTGGISLFKYYNNNDEKVALEGAEFTIYRSKEDADNKTNGVMIATSDSKGLVKFIGLEYGEDAKDDEKNKTESGTYEYDSKTKSTSYWIVETKVPNNYQATLKEPLEVKINKDSYTEDISLVKYEVENKPLIFDLALRKWVTQAIVIENGKQTVTKTGHDAWDDPEQVVKVELHRKKLNQVTVKFRYSIRVYNQGDIEGYAKEVKDYIPEGLKFIATDNPGWKDEGNNIISTKLLENTLLKPGEYADVEVLLTWTNSQDNMGVKVNTAEISKDYNKYGLPDKDSTPDNKKKGEDDIDDAPVMLSISTGQVRIYFTIGFIVLITVVGGIVLIKKYVL